MKNKLYFSIIRIDIIEPTADAIESAKQFALAKWAQRAIEHGNATPNNLSGSCKFCSLFCWFVFGGKLAGNAEHQWVVDNTNGIIDLTSYSGYQFYSDRSKYKPDRQFWLNGQHLSSLRDCLERSSLWANEFISQNN